MTLREYLEQTGQTAAQFARLVGTGRMNVSRWARGERRPRPHMIRKIADKTEGRVVLADWFGGVTL